METFGGQTPRNSKRIWFGTAAGVLAIAALAVLFVLDKSIFGSSAHPHESWIFWIVAIPAYFLLQMFAEAVLEGFWGSDSRIAKAVPIVLLVLFYAAYFLTSA